MANTSKKAARTTPTTKQEKTVVDKVAPIFPAVKTEKPKKTKMVRDSFTMPHEEYVQIADIKERCLKAGVATKKSEILRAALQRLATLSDATLLKTIESLEKIKTGRPSKR